MSIEYVELKGTVKNYNDMDSVYKKLVDLFNENLDYCTLDEPFREKSKDCLKYYITECYGAFGEVTEYMSKQFLIDFPGIVYEYQIEVFWDNGEREVIEIYCDGKKITQKQEDNLEVLYGDSEEDPEEESEW